MHFMFSLSQPFHSMKTAKFVGNILICTYFNSISNLFIYVLFHSSKLVIPGSRYSFTFHVVTAEYSNKQFSRQTGLLESKIDTSKSLFHCQQSLDADVVEIL